MDGVKCMLDNLNTQRGLAIGHGLLGLGCGVKENIVLAFKGIGVDHSSRNHGYGHLLASLRGSDEASELGQHSCRIIW